MREHKTSDGIIKFKEPSVLELVSVQGRLLKKVDMTSPDITVEECAVELSQLLRKYFDFSGMEKIKTFEEAEQDIECVEFIILCSLETISKLGDVSKKKTLLRTPIMPTQEESSQKSSEA